MKKSIKIIILTILAITIINIRIFAFTPNPPSNVILEGNADGIVFIPGEEPFLSASKILPGDTVKRTMVIENKYDVSYEIFMRSERVSTQEEYDLLNKLELTITYDGDIIYNGPACGGDELMENISLGTVKPGDSKKLYAEVNLDGPSTGNEYKNKCAEVNWIFTATNNGKTDYPKVLPQTGDNRSKIYCILLITSGILLLMNKKEAIEK